MKKLIVIIGVAALLATVFSASAEPAYQNQTKLSAVMWGPGSTNLATPIFFDVRKQQNFSFNPVTRGVTTATNTYSLSFSDNGTTFSTNSFSRIQYTFDTPSAIQGESITNIACGGHGYVVLYNVYCTQQTTNTVYGPVKIP